MKEKEEEKQEPVKEAQPLKEEDLEQVNGGAGEGVTWVCEKCGEEFRGSLNIRKHQRYGCH